MLCNYLPQLREAVAGLARMAFEEDLPGEDLTAGVLSLQNRSATAKLICREPISMCGSVWYEEILTVYRDLNPDLELNVTCFFEDGTRVDRGETLFRLRGSTAALVGFERTFLNFLGRGIGIAGATRVFVEALRRCNGHTQILDTRKTLPGFRYFDKYAVLCGGGRNHRMSLSDQVLIKENHIAEFKGVGAALAHVRAQLPPEVIVQIEVQNLAELGEALAAHCPIIMLDNFTPAMVREACNLERGASLLEVSGGINLGNIAAFTQPTLDRISIGAITHSIKAPDLSLLVTEE